MNIIRIYNNVRKKHDCHQIKKYDIHNTLNCGSTNKKGLFGAKIVLE